MSMHLIYGSFDALCVEQVLVRVVASCRPAWFTLVCQRWKHHEICSRCQPTWLTEPNSWREKKCCAFAAKKREKPNASRSDYPERTASGVPVTVGGGGRIFDLSRFDKQKMKSAKLAQHGGLYWHVALR